MHIRRYAPILVAFAMLVIGVSCSSVASHVNASPTDQATIIACGNVSAPDGA